jgi:hypothetical protein
LRTHQIITKALAAVAAVIKDKNGESNLLLSPFLSILVTYSCSENFFLEWLGLASLSPIYLKVSSHYPFMYQRGKILN